ncbi:MAG: hypothetical protein NTY80_04170 [candidate division SR1 bacterium]|nr:hypothetical protein [candidate division SR1 bacterium]
MGTLSLNKDSVYAERFRSGPFGLEIKDSLQTALNLETFTEEQKKETLSFLEKLESVDGDEGLPFFTIKKKGITPANLEKILSPLVSLFEGYEHLNENIKIQISHEILQATQDIPTPEKVLFIRAPNGSQRVEDTMHEYLGDMLAKKHDLNVRSDDGDGGYFQTIKTPYNDEFGAVWVTEHLLTKKPNAIIVVISTYLRPRYSIMRQALDERNKHRITPDKLRTMTDEEVKDAYYAPSYD